VSLDKLCNSFHASRISLRLLSVRLSYAQLIRIYYCSVKKGFLGITTHLSYWSMPSTSSKVLMWQSDWSSVCLLSQI